MSREMWIRILIHEQDNNDYQCRIYL